MLDPKSKLIAERLHLWFKKESVLEFIDPWCSSVDIHAGAAWIKELGEQIEKAQFAIICLTRQNFNAPWVNYEAGAIFGKLGKNVCPYLFEMRVGDLENSPLPQLFYAVEANREGTLKLLKALNETAKQLSMNYLEDTALEKRFEFYWEDLGKSLLEIGKLPTNLVESTSKKQVTVPSEIVVHNSLDTKCDHLLDAMQLLSTSLLSVIEQQIKSKDNLIQELVRDGNTYKPELIRLKVEKEALEEHMPKFRETLDSLSHLMEKAKSYKKISRWLEVIISENKHQEISKEVLDKANPPRNQEEDETFHKIFCEYLKWVVDGLNRGGPVKRIPSIPVLPVQIYREAFENLKHKAHSRLSNDEVAMLMEFIDHLLGCLGSSNKLLEE